MTRPANDREEEDAAPYLLGRSTGALSPAQASRLTRMAHAAIAQTRQEPTMHPIYTLGYQASTPADLAEYVRHLGALLADIRLRPTSPNPTWRPDALVALVGSPNYCGLPLLGNTNYNNDGPIALANPAAAVEIVRVWLRTRPVILLCACRDQSTCHRTDAAAYLQAALGGAVEHLPGRIAQWQQAVPA